MVDKPTPIDKSEYEAINNALDIAYGKLEWWHRYLGFDGNIHRIYYHGGDRIEELIARLRGEIAFIAKQVENVNKEVGDLQDKFNELLITIDQIVQEQFENARPGIINDVVDRVNSELSGIAAEIEGGIPLLNQVAYHGYHAKASDVTGTSQFMVQPKTVRNAVMQSIYRDPITGDWYNVQTDGYTPEGMTITRTDAHGDYLSNMWVKEGGHGHQMTFVNDGSTTPWMLIAHNNAYKFVRYADNTTITITDVPDTIQTPTRWADALAYSQEEGDGAMVQWVDSDQAANSKLAAYSANWNSVNHTFTFGDKVTTFDLSDYVDLNQQVWQGVAILKKSDITGVDVATETGKYVIAIGVGPANSNTKMHLFEYDMVASKIVYIDTISHLERVMVPYRKLGSSSWLGEYELEGFANIRLDSPNAKGKVASGIAYAISTGTIGERTTYIYGFNNIINHATTITSNLAASSETVTKFNTEDYTEMWRLSKPGTYELTSDVFSAFTDAPFMWRGSEKAGTAAPWTLEVTIPNHGGDYIQRLTRRSEQGLVIYERQIDIVAADGFGAQYKPHTIGKWNLTQNASDNTPRINDWVTSIDQLLEPGRHYYLRNFEVQKIAPDIASIYPDKGFWLDVMVSPDVGGDTGKHIIQTLTFNNTTYQDISIQRNVTYQPDVYGNGGTFVATVSGWYSTSQGTLAWSTIPALGTTISARTASGTTELKAFQISGITGTGATAGLITTLPEDFRPKYGDTWGHPVALANGSVTWFGMATVKTSGAFYLTNAMLPAGQTITTSTTLTFSVKYNN